MEHADYLHAAVRLVYQAALDARQWDAALGSVANAIGAHKSLLNEVAGEATGVIVSAGFEPAHVRLLHHEMVSRMPGWISAIAVGASLRQSSAISDTDFRRSELYNEAVRPAGGFYGIVAPLVRTPARQVYLSAGRELGAEDFSTEDVDALNVIVPHLINSLEIGSRLARANLYAQSLLDVLDRANVGIILFDAALRPVFVNRYADALAAHGAGVVVTKNNVAASKHAETRLLQQAMAQCVALHRAKPADRDSGLLRAVPMRCYLSREPSRPALVARVMPFATPEQPGRDMERREAGTACGALFLSEPDRPLALDVDALTESFQLSRREAQLALLIANGYGLAEAASTLMIGIGTARGYLKQVLGKTCTHRRAELVALVLRSSLCAFGFADGRYGNGGE
ncbi:helix-turn-helix transcriptional regulator [Paraburkholderia sp. MMS20-SJTR3]|uniref:Helix-turn-helix transcriptional regulator n=1 Tax=Paraburkholderia sejongensis TaxID=2886946 RepID=A0ABS8JYG8_9BURK|nr:helix-turn-helix transcriptional regulator [Paraburkholderia sp. MMS20-SJTR3]MCC8394689.1 helix-turn-helix transcriptional regulator [Paraburkholderia sp. MMS20-SJTR3]